MMESKNVNILLLFDDEVQKNNMPTYILLFDIGLKNLIYYE